MLRELTVQILFKSIFLGANFFVRANNDTLKFFEAIALKIGHWYTPDMAVMIHQCHTWKKPKCAYMPHKFVSYFLFNIKLLTSVLCTVCPNHPIKPLSIF